MLLESYQALKIVPLAWIIFSLILGYLKVENNDHDPSSILASVHRFHINEYLC